MTESEALARMVAPGQRRAGKPHSGVIQILVTSSCNLACISCTQASQIRRAPWFMTPEQFEQAIASLDGYFGIVGVFGGCPTISPYFADYCRILRERVPKDRCGLWANNLMGKGADCRTTFSPFVSNLNVHLDRKAYDEFLSDWPEARPFGLTQESRHSPPFVSMCDVGVPESERWELISRCPINQHWSAGIGVFRGQLRAWFCEIAMAASILHQDEPDFPDTGLILTYPDGEHCWFEGSTFDVPVYRTSNARPVKWWELGMGAFTRQIRKHCHDCGVPMQGRGELSQSSDGAEQVSETHAAVFRPKKQGRRVELVTTREQLGQPLSLMTRYLENARE